MKGNLSHTFGESGWCTMSACHCNAFTVGQWLEKDILCGALITALSQFWRNCNLMVTMPTDVRLSVLLTACLTQPKVSKSLGFAIQQWSLLCIRTSLKTEAVWPDKSGQRKLIGSREHTLLTKRPAGRFKESPLVNCHACRDACNAYYYPLRTASALAGDENREDWFHQRKSLISHWPTSVSSESEKHNTEKYSLKAWRAEIIPMFSHSCLQPQKECILQQYLCPAVT